MKSTLSLLLLVLAACGDNNPSKQAAPDATPAVDAAPALPRAIVVAGDFGGADHPGVMAAIDPDTQAVTKAIAPQGAVGDDPVLRHRTGELLVVNRSDGNNVTILDDQTYAFVAQESTGTGSNPQDVAVVGNKLYVPTLAGKGVVTIDRTSHALHEIDLSADDPDGKPNCESIYAVGTKLYVACGLLDDSDPFLSPRGLGKVYVIDSATDLKVATITLTTKNPLGFLELAPSTSPLAGALVVPTIDFATGNGCVEAIPTDGSTTTTCIVQNTALGGFANRVDFRGTGAAMTMWMSVSATYPDANVQGYDFSTHALFPAIVTPVAEHITDIAACPHDRYVMADQTMNASGIRIRDASTEVTAAPLDVGLAPKSSHGIVCY